MSASAFLVFVGCFIIAAAIFLGFDAIEKQLRRIATALEGDDDEDDGDGRKLIFQIKKEEPRKNRGDKVVDIATRR